MALNFAKTLNLSKSGSNSFILMLLQSGFFGIFFGSISICAETLVTQEFEMKFVQGAIFLSGFSGILLTLFYSFLQSRISFSALSLANLIFITIITFLLRFGFDFIEKRQVVFALFILFGPLFIISQVAFWGTATRLFDLRQGKRLFGIIDIGLLVGILLTAITFLVLGQLKFDTINQLYFSMVSIFMAFVLQIFIARNLKKPKQEEAKEELKTKPVQESEKIGMLKLMMDKYLRQIVVFVVLSGFTLLFIYSSFLNASVEKYPEEISRQQFFSAVTLTMVVFSILLKSFAYNNLMKTYGLKMGLLITPVVIGLFTVITAIVGSFGYHAESKIFIFYFVLMALSRVLSYSLNASIERPAFKLLYQSLDKKIRFDVQAKVDGTVNEIAFLSAGGIVFLLGILSFFQVIHYSYVLVGIVILWVFIALRLHKEYKASLENSLVAKEGAGQEVQTNYSEKLLVLIKDENVAFNKRKTGLFLLKAIDPMVYENVILDMFDSASEEMKRLSVQEVKSLNLTDAVERFDKINGEISSEEFKNEIKSYTSFIKKQIKTIKSGVPDKFLKSNNYRDRLLLSRYIEKSTDKEVHAFLNVLLRDIHPDVRMAAINASGQVNSSALISGVIDNLGSQKYYSNAYNAILRIGESAIDHLEQQYNKSDADKRTKLLIIKLFGEIKGEKAIQHLLDKLNLQDLELLNNVALALKKCNYMATELDRQNINPAITLIISVIAWNYAALLSFDPEEMIPEVKTALEEEIAFNFDLLFNLLSIAYNKNSVQIVRENLETNTAESIGFAVELLDIFIAEEQKQVLTMILDDTQLSEKVRNLQSEFPVDKMEPRETLMAIMNRDYNYMNTWTKACAILSFNNLKDREISIDIVAQLFNPDVLLHETAGLVINEIDANVMPSMKDRIEKTILSHINNALELKEKSRCRLLIEKILFLNKIPYFAGFSGEFIRKVGLALNSVSLTDNQELNRIDILNNAFLFVAKGSIEIFPEGTIDGLGNKKGDRILSEGSYILQENIDGILKIKALEGSVIHLLDNENFNELVFNNRELIPSIIEFNEHYI